MASTALVERATGDLVTQQDPAFWEVMQQVVTMGDLKGLSSEHKTKYYRYLCERVGLSPETLPFSYIVTQGGAVKLYANRNATDLLRKVHHVDVTIVGRERVQDDKGNPMYMVTVRASTPDGRTDESIGVVPLTGLVGDAFCNALMKCETKAKRRATLSIVGLSLMDELEAQSLAGTRTFTPAEFERAESALPAEASPAPPLRATSDPPSPVPSSVHQRAEIRRLAGAGYPITPELAARGLESVDDLDAEAAQTLITAGRAYLRTPRTTTAAAPAPAVERVTPDAPFVLTAEQIRLFWATGAQEGWTKEAKRQTLGELFPDHPRDQEGHVSIKGLSRVEFDQMIALFEDRLALAYDEGGKPVLRPAGPPAEGA